MEIRLRRGLPRTFQDNEKAATLRDSTGPYVCLTSVSGDVVVSLVSSSDARPLKGKLRHIQILRSLFEKIPI